MFLTKDKYISILAGLKEFFFSNQSLLILENELTKDTKKGVQQKSVTL